MASNAANIGNQAIQAYGNQRTVVPSAGGGLIKTPAEAKDPFNWKKIIAQQKAEEQRKAAAKKRITTPSAPKAVAQAAPDPFAGMTAKQQLDFFRDFNGGALPPGMTPEIAALIDSGVDITGIAAANPAIANVITQMQALITQLPADYAAGKASVNASYDQLTGDVLDSGKNWMQDLYGRMVDPNDPNAALMQQDPALTAYAQGMSTIDETSDANRATDLAWFDKMQQNAAATYQGLIASLAATAATPAKASGGGRGGGGRRGGRGGGGGGGGSVNGWKVPTNTLTNVTSATDTATQTDTGFSPGFHEALLEATQFDPDLQALAQRIWEGSSQDARGVTQEAAKRLTETETSQEDLATQRALHEAWYANQPAASQAAIATMLRNNPGAVLGDDPTTTNRTERWHIPVKEGQGTTNVPQVIIPTPEQSAANALGEELLANSSKFGARALTNKIFGPKVGKYAGARPGVASPAALMEEKSKGAISPQQLKILESKGATDLSKAKSVIPGGKFDIQNWAQGGGFVPFGQTEETLGKENVKNINYLNYILDSILPWNPNANTVPTKEQMVSQGKDSSTYQSKNTNKSWANALAQSPWDLTPDIPNVAIQNNPASNPAGFTITPGATPSQAETVDVADPDLPMGFGMSRPSRTPAKSTKELAGLYDRPRVQSAAKDRIKTPFGTVTRPKAKAPIAPKTSPLDSIVTPFGKVTRPRVAPKGVKSNEPEKTPAKSDPNKATALFGLKVPKDLFKRPVKKPAPKKGK